MIVIVLPAYDEAAGIGRLLERIRPTELDVSGRGRSRVEQ